MKLKRKALQAAASAAIGYSLGSINPAYIIGFINGYDIRERGSGNAGASNTVMPEGKAAGFLVMAFDIGKATAAVATCRKLFPKFKSAGETAGAATIFGHMFPATLNYKGGKGLSCLFGTLLGFKGKEITPVMAIELSILAATKYICLVPLTGSIVLPLLHGIITGNWQGAAVLGSVAPPIFVKHIPNIKRIKEGKEFKINFLWNKEGELKRTGWTEDLKMLS